MLQIFFDTLNIYSNESKIIFFNFHYTDCCVLLPDKTQYEYKRQFSCLFAINNAQLECERQITVTICLLQQRQTNDRIPRFEILCYVSVKLTDGKLHREKRSYTRRNVVNFSMETLNFTCFDYISAFRIVQNQITVQRCQFNIILKQSISWILHKQKFCKPMEEILSFNL